MVLVGWFAPTDLWYLMIDYKQIAKEFGCCISIGKYGLKWLPKDPSGKAYKLFNIIPLDGWITSPKEIMEAFANDPDFKISYSKNDNKKGDSK